MENWRRILGAVRQQNPNTYGLLNSCRAKNMRNGTLVLDFASDLLKSKMEKEENVRVVQEALKQVLGEEIDVRCRTSTSAATATRAPCGGSRSRAAGRQAGGRGQGAGRVGRASVMRTKIEHRRLSGKPQSCSRRALKASAVLLWG